MEIFIELFRSHASVASSFIQYIVYTASALLFLNGLWAAFKGWRWLRKPTPAEIEQQDQSPLSAENPLVMIIMKTFGSTGQNTGHPLSHPSFIADATRQMAENLFESRYMESLTMSSNLLPPLGFIGTVFGMILIFLAKVNPGSELNTIGLGTALFTTLLALFLFVILEIIKMWLVRLAKHRIEIGLILAMEKQS
ncbi:MAG: MotA/TolQ/ExbB proton channel family protein [Desulfosudaceae bacterium]